MMTTDDFVEFYKAIHEKRVPFPWQKSLVERLLHGEGWTNIAVPTASGKTSVLDAAVFTLAAQAALPITERVPLRTFFVVDRRLVVDDVTEHASKIALALEKPDSAITRRVSEALLSFGGEVPLRVATLRGGMYRSNDWADIPNQPLICVSTVDQVGSRMLFRGYGLRWERLPIDAAFVTNDSLLIVDEAHLSAPFLETAKAVAKRQLDAEIPIFRPLTVVEMSATRRESDGSEIKLEGEDLAETSPLFARLNRPKPAELRESGDLVADAVAGALEFKKSAPLVGVVVNTVRTAREIFEKLRQGRPEDSTLLLTGRIRPFDRDKLLDTFGARIKADRDRDVPEDLIVVATQTVEVGADIDFDALVTEAAPIDSLRQRFGRLNRLGKGEPKALILKPKKEKQETIYGAAAENTWAWLLQQAGTARTIDFAAVPMGDRFQQFGNDEMLPEKQVAPVLVKSFIEAWSCTNPQPHPNPDVAPFLHGPKALEAADVQVVWRKDLQGADEHWIAALALLPPQSMEALPLPLWQVRKWLDGEEPGTAMDIEAAEAPPTAEAKTRFQRRFVRWFGPDKSEVLYDIRKIAPGDTIVVPAEYGGTDRFGWDPKATVTDVADECSEVRANSGRGREALRIATAEVAESNGLKLGDLEPSDLKSMFDGQYRDISFYGSDDQVPPWMIGFKPRKRRTASAKAVDSDEETETDNSSLTEPVTLADHTDHVAAKVAKFAGGCGLPGALSEIVLQAAKLHDLGKSDPRFQLMLAPTGSLLGLLAKGKKTTSVAEWKTRSEQSGYPKGARHEFLSVAMAEQHLWPNEDARDLGLYLIGTHHGHGRRLAPFWEEASIEPVTSTLYGTVQCTPAEAVRYARFGSGWTELVARLTRRYGWWALAYLESILRRADCVASREEEQNAIKQEPIDAENH